MNKKDINDKRIVGGASQKNTWGRSPKRKKVFNKKMEKGEPPP